MCCAARVLLARCRPKRVEEITTVKPDRTHLKAMSFVFALLLAVLPASPLMAGMLDTSSLLYAASAEAERAALTQRLETPDVQEALGRLGVDPADAKARVARLTDAELADLNARLDRLPAGAGVLEAVLIVFLVFVITDALGITNIFAFVHPPN